MAESSGKAVGYRAAGAITEDSIVTSVLQQKVFSYLNVKKEYDVSDFKTKIQIAIQDII